MQEHRQYKPTKKTLKFFQRASGEISSIENMHLQQPSESCSHIHNDIIMKDVPCH
jgi:hypothetical protein